MIGVWTGCGYDTIPLIFPPPGILGYGACVGAIVSDPPQPVGVQDDGGEDDEIFVII